MQSKQDDGVKVGQNVPARTSQKIADNTNTSEKTVRRDAKFDVQKIGPMHCTGIKAVAKFWSEFPDKCVECKVGSKLEFELE